MSENITTPINGDELSTAEKKRIVRDMTIDHIIAWCKNNNALPWLEAKMSETVERKHYPYVKERDANGKLKCKLDENGKRIPDYSKPPKIHTQPIGFMEIKTAFIREFMPGLIVGKKTAPAATMADKLRAALEEG